MCATVIRRVGGLEVMCGLRIGALPVIRRVGGLEVPWACLHASINVIRRVGGLEDNREGACLSC